MESARPVSPKASWSAFLVSSLFHGMLLLGIGGLVISQGYVPKTPFVGEIMPDTGPMETEQEVLVEPESGSPGPPMEVPDAAASQTIPHTMPVVPASFATPSVLAAATGPSLPGVMSFSGATAGMGMGLGGGGTGQGVGKGMGNMTTPFGSTEQSAGTLRGVFFDLKRKADGSPSGMTPAEYLKEVESFVERDWRVDETLGKFYRLSQSIFASQFFIPLQTANAAPAAFKAEKEVRPAMWAILYSGQFKSPESGKFRFVGYADDVILVRVNGRRVLDGSRSSLGFDRNSKGLTKVSSTDAPAGHTAGNGRLSYGSWMDLSQGQANSIEVLLGECPGGQFCAFLLIENKDGNYAKEASGRPVLPIFRLADVRLDFDAAIQARTAPAIETNGPIFGD